MIVEKSFMLLQAPRNDWFGVFPFSRLAALFQMFILQQEMSIKGSLTWWQINWNLWNTMGATLTEGRRRKQPACAPQRGGSLVRWVQPFLKQSLGSSKQHYDLQWQQRKEEVSWICTQCDIDLGRAMVWVIYLESVVMSRATSCFIGTLWQRWMPV